MDFSSLLGGGSGGGSGSAASSSAKAQIGAVTFGSSNSPDLSVLVAVGAIAILGLLGILLLTRN